MSGYAEIAAPATGVDRVAASATMIRNPHVAPELMPALHARVDRRHTCEIVPMRERLRVERHLGPNRTATIDGAPDVDAVADLDPVGVDVDRGARGEGRGGEPKPECRGQTERDPAPRHERPPQGAFRRLPEPHRCEPTLTALPESTL
jgi:hypothetical protein